MKKVLLISVIVISVCIIITWIHLPRAISILLSHDFKTPVKVEDVNFKKDQINFSNFSIKTKKGQIKEAFHAETISINAKLKELISSKRTIESIIIKDIQIALEYYNKSGSENNWSELIKTNTKSKKKGSYLIKKVVLKNLTVTVYTKDGRKKRYPTIENLEVYNITEESGFPIDKIEQAIFKEVLKSIFQKLNLKELIKSLNPTKIVPGVLKKIPFIGSSSTSQSHP